MQDIYKLRELKLEILSRCPLRCPHCSSEASLEQTDALDPDLVLPLVRTFVSLGGESMAISGGEPLEHPRLLDILVAIAGQGIVTTLYTSGTHGTNGLVPISMGLAEELKPLIGGVVFSLQGATASEHDGFTGRSGSFQATLSSLAACQRAGIPLSVHFVPTAADYRSLPSLVVLLKRLGVPRVSLLRFVPHGRGAHHPLALDTGQLRELRSIVESLAVDSGIVVRTGSPYRILHLPSSPPCTAGIDRLLITPEGTAYPCDAFKGFDYEDAYRNVFAAGLEAVWTRSRFLERVRCLVGELPAACRGCSHAATCGGGCLAQRAFAARALDASNRDRDCMMVEAGSTRGE